MVDQTFPSWFANRYPGARIIAIEPEGSNFAMLQRNVRAYPAITPMHAALWSQSAELDVVDFGTGTWGYRVAPSRQSKRATGQTLVGLTIGALIRDCDLEFIDLLKVDIEGAEKDVFEQSDDWIDKVGAIAIEIHDWHEGARQSVERAVARFEFKGDNGENALFFRNDYAPRGARPHGSVSHRE